MDSKRQLSVCPLEIQDIATGITEDIATKATNHRYYCLNPHSYIEALNDRRFWDALANAETLLADGVGIIWAKKLIRKTPPPRITGYEIFASLCARHAASPKNRIFMLGATDAVLEAMEMRLAREYPELTICGKISPPFLPEFSETQAREFAATINKANTDLLLVGLTAPKQEILIEQMWPHLSVVSIAAIGAVFDFYAGTKERAPAWATNAGLEWAFRIAKEPRRMWRRTVISGSLFGIDLISGRFGRNVA